MKRTDENANNNIDIERLARLSRLSLTPEQSKHAAAELKEMADYTYPLLCEETIALPFSYSSTECGLREDEPVIPEPSECKRILECAPSTENGYIAVPRVISEESEK